MKLPCPRQQLIQYLRKLAVTLKRVLLQRQAAHVKIAAERRSQQFCTLPVRQRKGNTPLSAWRQPAAPQPAKRFLEPPARS
ncbi:hypothetical protein D3C73_855470 [compost metagenome]